MFLKEKDSDIFLQLCPSSFLHTNSIKDLRQEINMRDDTGPRWCSCHWTGTMTETSPSALLIIADESNQQLVCVFCKIVKMSREPRHTFWLLLRLCSSQRQKKIIYLVCQLSKPVGLLLVSALPAQTLCRGLALSQWRCTTHSRLAQNLCEVWNWDIFIIFPFTRKLLLWNVTGRYCSYCQQIGQRETLIFSFYCQKGF